MAYLAIGIIGATVMPHNLYLHSALGAEPQASKKRPLDPRRYFLQHDRYYGRADHCVPHQCRYPGARGDHVLRENSVVVAGGEVVHFAEDSDWIQVAYPDPCAAARTRRRPAFCSRSRCLASGQSSTITGTLAGQVVMEGFMHWRLSPWVRRLITRGLAIMPAIFIIGVRGEGSVNDLLVPQPGRAGAAITVGDVPAAAFHQFAEANGRVVERMVPA